MAEIKLRCVGKYHHIARGEIHLPGEEFTADEDHAAYLLRDAPGCFEEVVVKAPEAPPRDKAVKRPRVRKQAP